MKWFNDVINTIWQLFVVSAAHHCIFKAFLILWVSLKVLWWCRSHVCTWGLLGPYWAYTLLHYPQWFTPVVTQNRWNWDIHNTKWCYHANLYNKEVTFTLSVKILPSKVKLLSSLLSWQLAEKYRTAIKCINPLAMKYGSILLLMLFIIINSKPF